MENKIGPGFFTRKTPDLGQADVIFTVYGILDLGGDVGHPGMFDFTVDSPKTVKFLDQHNLNTSLAVIGKILALRDLGRNALPSELRAKYPEATGGALASVQYLMNDPTGAAAYARAAVGLAEFSYGYDATKVDYSNMPGPNGETVKARNLRKAKLYEVSQVVFGMNPGTSVISTKNASEAELAARLERDLVALERMMIRQMSAEIDEALKRG
jgi:hypothetical protein